MKLLKALLVCSFLSSLFVLNSALASNCKSPITQTEINECSYLELQDETKKINKTYSKLQAKLTPIQKQQVKEVQLAWIKFKDLSCEFEASDVKGGSAYSMVLAFCLIRYTRQRNKELDALNHCEDGYIGCPVM